VQLKIHPKRAFHYRIHPDSSSSRLILHQTVDFMLHYYAPADIILPAGKGGDRLPRTRMADKERVMKVVAFNGSGRKGGNTYWLLKAVLEELQAEGAETELVQMADQGPIQGCTACYRCMEQKNMKCAIETDPFNEYFQKIREADGILLGSPVYFSDITAGMKALIERCGLVARANGNVLRRKVGAGVIAVRRAGSNHSLASLNYLFLISEMIVPGSSYWNMGFGRDPGEVTGDAEGMETMKTLGKNMAWLLKKISVRETIAP
jgi:multimeric flavodoxin WrbA